LKTYTYKYKIDMYNYSNSIRWFKCPNCNSEMNIHTVIIKGFADHIEVPCEVCKKSSIKVRHDAGTNPIIKLIDKK